jgi:hypothetical protein
MLQKLTAMKKQRIVKEKFRSKLSLSNGKRKMLKWELLDQVMMMILYVLVANKKATRQTDHQNVKTIHNPRMKSQRRTWEKAMNTIPSRCHFETGQMTSILHRFTQMLYKDASRSVSYSTEPGYL